MSTGIKKFGGTLDGIFSKDNEEKNNFVHETQTLPIKNIKSSSYQPRSLFEKNSLEQLARSIKDKGVLQPVIVRVLDNGIFELVAGERRLRAATLAGLIEIPVVIRNVTDEETAVIALIENLQREDLGALEEANGYKKLIEDFALTHEQIAISVGKSRATITNVLRLLTLEQNVQEMLSDKKIDMGHARALLSLIGQDQIRVAEIVVQKDLSVRATELLVQNLLKNPDGAKQINTKYLDLVDDWYKRMPKHLEIKITVKDNGKGRAVINFTHPDELEWIIGKIEQ